MWSADPIELQLEFTKIATHARIDQNDFTRDKNVDFANRTVLDTLGAYDVICG